MFHLVPSLLRNGKPYQMKREPTGSCHCQSRPTPREGGLSFPTTKKLPQTGAGMARGGGGAVTVLSRALPGCSYVLALVLADALGTTPSLSRDSCMSMLGRSVGTRPGGGRGRRRWGVSDQSAARDTTETEVRRGQSVEVPDRGHGLSTGLAGWEGVDRGESCGAGRGGSLPAFSFCSVRTSRTPENCFKV